MLGEACPVLPSGTCSEALPGTQERRWPSAPGCCRGRGCHSRAGRRGGGGGVLTRQCGGQGWHGSWSTQHPPFCGRPSPEAAFSCLPDSTKGLLSGYKYIGAWTSLTSCQDQHRLPRPAPLHSPGKPRLHGLHFHCPRTEPGETGARTRKPPYCRGPPHKGGEPSGAELQPCWRGNPRADRAPESIKAEERGSSTREKGEETETKGT